MGKAEPPRELLKGDRSSSTKRPGQEVVEVFEKIEEDVGKDIVEPDLGALAWDGQRVVSGAIWKGAGGIGGGGAGRARAKEGSKGGRGGRRKVGRSKRGEREGRRERELGGRLGWGAQE